MWMAAQCCGSWAPIDARHGGTPVAALGEVAAVAEARHQNRPGTGDPLHTPSRCCGLAGEPEPGQRGADHVERVGGVATVLGRIGERLDHLVELDDRARPAVRDDQWFGLSVGRALMDEVDVEPVDGRDVLVESVQPGLAGPPVVAVAPVPAHVSDPIQRGALVPVVDRLPLRPAGFRQPSSEVAEDLVGHIDSVWAHGHVVRHQRRP